MIVPCIYLRGGQAVPLTSTKPSTIGCGDPIEALRALCLVGEVVVVDLDRERGEGDNTDVIKAMLPVAEIIVGGGITTADAALTWMDLGVNKVILRAALPNLREILKELPSNRVVLQIQAQASDDAADLVARVAELDGLATELLIKFVDQQGKETGIATASKALTALGGMKLQKGTRVTVAGGICSTAGIMTVDSAGLVAQVGTALHTGTLQLGDVVCAFVKTDRPDGLYTTVVVDQQGVALGLVYSDDASIQAAVKRRKGIYHSRKRGLWEKGLTSGATQELVSIQLDCDRDAIRYVVHQNGAGFCHLERRTCWTGDAGVGKLMRTLEDRVKNPVAKSYTNRLLSDDTLLHSKLLEEAQELVEAVTPQEIAAECADVVYFAAVICARGGVPWHAVETNLDRKSLRVRRRKGDAHLDRTPQIISKKAAAAASSSSSAPAPAPAASSSSSPPPAPAPVAPVAPADQQAPKQGETTPTQDVEQHKSADEGAEAEASEAGEDSERKRRKI